MYRPSRSVVNVEHERHVERILFRGSKQERATRGEISQYMYSQYMYWEALLLG